MDMRALTRTIRRLRAENRMLRRALSAGTASSAGGGVSPLAPARFPDLPAIDGVDLAAAAAGVKYKGRADVMLARLAPGSRVAGVFTRSATRAASILDCEAKIGLESDDGAAILVNAGNSNAFTGDAGRQSVRALAGAVAAALDLPESRVFTASTGVIGVPLPHDRITARIADLVSGLAPDGLAAAAQAIRTTDTFPKGASAQTEIDGTRVTIAGIAKGSGMIAPDMATMLVYIFTDVAISRAALQQVVTDLNTRTFNAITVDGDTSTSDMLLVGATGRAGNAEITDADSPQGKAFSAALEKVMLDLAHQVVRDGEGATKFVEIAVTGAQDDADAMRVARAIANSPLVKTAIAGEDPNWGRIVMAVGKSGARADRDRLAIRFGDVLVAERGWVAETYREEDGAAHMKQTDLRIGVDLGLGDGQAVMWTCDLTHGYISINADYRS